MSQQQPANFAHGQRPTAIDAPPRSSKHGRVVAEVGVFEKGSGSRDYWKVIQRIENEKETLVRRGYYVGRNNDWNWAQDALLLPPEVDARLTARATVEGILND